MSFFKNASPQIINLGTDDKSARLLPPEVPTRPQHLPKFFIFAPKGPNVPQLIAGANDLLQKYGDDGFDPLSPYFNHATRLLMKMMGEANTCVVHRVIPEDVKSRSNMAIYIDVLPCKVTNYVRKADGSLSIDPETEEPKVDNSNPEIDGYKIKFIKEFYNEDDIELGRRVSKTGTMYINEPDEVIFDQTLGEEIVIPGKKITSTMYPLFEFKASSYGKYYDNIGLSFELLPYAEQKPEYLADTRSLFYNLRLFTRKDILSSPTLVKSIYGETEVEFTFKKDAVYSIIPDEILDLTHRLESNYSNTTSDLLPLRYLDYETPYIYYNELNKVLKMFVTSELPYINNDLVVYDDGLTAVNSDWFDFTTIDLDEVLEFETYLFNIFNGKSSKGVPYYSVQMSDLKSTFKGSQEELNITGTIPMYLSGGDDGTLSDDLYEREVVKCLDEYLDPDSPVQDTATNLETILYDSGFTVPTKLRLFDFIALRKNTVVVVGVHSHTLGEKYNSLSETRSIGNALVTRARLYPESSYFGTRTCRAMVLTQSGTDRSGTSKERFPMTFDFAVKAARKMGAGDGNWKSVYRFDGQPNSSVTELINIQPNFIPNSIKPTLWDTGLVWVQPYDMFTFHYPAMKTVYPDDTSILNSFYSVMAVATCSTVADDIWRAFTGRIPLSDEAFLAEVQAAMNKRVNGIFGGIMEVAGIAYMEPLDELRGYSWQAKFMLFGGVMKTVMVYRTEAYRMSDYASATTGVSL